MVGEGGVGGLAGLISFNTINCAVIELCSKGGVYVRFQARKIASHRDRGVYIDRIWGCRIVCDGAGG